jgi:phage terminase large subunit-like protein
MSFEDTKASILEELNQKLQLLSDYQKYNQLAFTYPETGPYARSLYKKQLEFFKAGKDHRFRMLSGGNGSGKSKTMTTEIAYHATGLYPEWWEGKVFKKINMIWIVAKSISTYRDSLQRHLLGSMGDPLGTGLIPSANIVSTSNIPNGGGAIGTILVKHKLGHIVTIIVKTFDMHRENLQGANVDLVAFDEEPPDDVYQEVIMRTRGTKTRDPGISMLAFTPLEGLTAVVMRYLPNGMFPKGNQHPTEKQRWAMQLTWEDSPHLSEEDKEAMLAEIPPHLRDARSKGIPALGSGRVYPFHEDDICVNFLKIGRHWKRAFGLDFGWNCTAAVWGAKDPQTGIIYLYGEYYDGQKAPYQHAYAIKERGSWMKGGCDPRGDKSSERDGSKLIDEYRNLGLDIVPGDNSVNSGIARIVGLLESGLLKVCYNLEHWWEEFRVYRYDSKDPNKIAKNQKDHLMDATKYLLSVFDDIAMSMDDIDDEDTPKYKPDRGRAGRSGITGY